jgi:hypothetical protein
MDKRRMSVNKLPATQIQNSNVEESDVPPPGDSTHLLYQKTEPFNTNESSIDYSHQYYSCLLRIWYEEGNGWRVSLQPVNTRERFGFTDLYSAMVFVEQVILEGKSK